MRKSRVGASGRKSSPSIVRRGRVGASGRNSSPLIVRRSRLVPQVERARLQLLGEAGWCLR